MNNDMKAIEFAQTLLDYFYPGRKAVSISNGEHVLSVNIHCDDGSISKVHGKWASDIKNLMKTEMNNDIPTPREKLQSEVMELELAGDNLAIEFENLMAQLAQHEPPARSSED